jgi:hypothetical protein
MDRKFGGAIEFMAGWVGGFDDVVEHETQPRRAW